MPRIGKKCVCRLCKNTGQDLSYKVRKRHEKLYGVISQIPSPVKNDVEMPSSPMRYDMTETSDQSSSEDVDEHSSEESNIDDYNSTSETDSDSSDEVETNVNPQWSFHHDKTIYENGPAVQKLPNSNMTVLQWLAMNFLLFTGHPSISKVAFTHNLQLQKVTHGDINNTLPSSYYEARKLIDPYVVKKVVFSVCVNECVIFRDSELFHYADLSKCPVCGEDRYLRSNSKKQVSRRRFIYIPIGPRLARLYGEISLAQLVMSHPGRTYNDNEMWDIHHSSAWKELYSEDGYFAGDKMGIALALELDGVNPFHNIGVLYSMTPIMLTILNLPRHIRNAFGNINLVGIIPAKGKSESSNLNVYLEILVDELLFLTKCKGYSAYANAPVDVKVKLLLHILDYPGLSKLFNQHGSGSLCGCHWCYVRGEHNKHLSKVVYLSNRSYLDIADPLRKDKTRFIMKKEDHSDRPKLRTLEDESSYRAAYERTSNKTQAQLVSSATGCKKSYTLAKLPGHNRINESLPDCCHTVKDVVQNIMNVITGNYVNTEKLVVAEKNMDRLHILQRSSPAKTFAVASQTTCKRQKVTKSQEPALPFRLTKSELIEADKCAEKIRVPIGFGLKPSPFISKPGSLKSHDWKQLATQGILKFCLKNTLSQQCRVTLFLLLDSITRLCNENISLCDIDDIESNLNRALALLERDFPLSLANITTHILHHIPDGIRRYGPVYGTWMYVFERFNSWICKRALNMRYPEATAVETFIIHDWCHFMMSSGRMPNEEVLKSNIEIQDGEIINSVNDKFVFPSKSRKEKKKLICLKGRDLQSIHKALGNPVCERCKTYRYSYHTESHPVTNRTVTLTSKMYDLETAKTVSSFVLCDFLRGSQDQKLDTGKFIAFGRICYFVEHVTGCESEVNKQCFAAIEWFDGIKYDDETRLWFSEMKSSKTSFIETNRLSHPLVTAVDNDLIWFLNSGKQKNVSL